jgi:hypothetical protein
MIPQILMPLDKKDLSIFEIPGIVVALLTLLVNLLLSRYSIMFD